MNRIVRATFWAVPPILFLVIIPQIILSRIPQNVLTQITQTTNINLASFVNGLSIIGVVLAVLSAVQTWSYKWSVVRPISSSLHMVVSLFLTLYLIGIGDSSTLGVTRIKFMGLGGPSGTNLSLAFNFTLTFLPLMFGVAVALKIIQKTMKFREDARNHRFDIEAEAKAATTSNQPVSPTAP